MLEYSSGSDNDDSSRALGAWYSQMNKKNNKLTFGSPGKTPKQLNKQRFHSFKVDPVNDGSDILSPSIRNKQRTNSYYSQQHKPSKTGILK